MITEYGMGEILGLVKLSSVGSLYSSYGNLVIEECKEFIDIIYDETLSLLNDNKTLLNKIALNLLEKETLHEDEIERLLKNE